MDIQDIRRAKLRRWVATHGIPAAEKSYFSQILNGASFGERAARRLERDYKMGVGALDQADNLKAGEIKPTLPDGLIDAQELIRLINYYKDSTELGRIQIMDAAEEAAKIVIARRGKAAQD